MHPFCQNHIKIDIWKHFKLKWSYFVVFFFYLLHNLQHTQHEEKTERKPIIISCPTTSDTILRPNLRCMRFLPIQVGKRRKRYHHGHNRCLRYCRWLRHTGSHLARGTTKHWGHKRTTHIRPDTTTKWHVSVCQNTKKTCIMVALGLESSEHKHTH